MTNFAKDVYTGVFGTQAYTVTFPFLSDTHVTAFVGGTEYFSPADWTLNAAGTLLTFTNPTIQNGDSIIIARSTPNTTAGRLVDFQNGATLTESDLDTSYLQLLYVLQENFDQQGEKLGLLAATLANWDAQSKRITLLADSVDQQDAVTRKDLEAEAMSSGNLPVVTGGENDYMLQVVGGAWSVEAPAALKAALGIDALEAGRLRAAYSLSGTFYISASATWYESASSRTVLSQLYKEHDTDTDVTTTSDSVILAADSGKYLVTLMTKFYNDDAAAVGDVNIRLTDEVDGPSQTGHILMSQERLPLATGALSNQENTRWQNRQIVIDTAGSSKTLVVRNRSLTGLPKFVGGSKLVLERLPT